MISKTYKTMAAATVAIAALCWAPQAPKAAAVVYDDFEGATIDRTKWANLEFVRRVENGVLKSELTRFGSNGSNTLNFVDTNAVSAFQADVTMTEVINVGARARARLTGFFFNDGTPGVDQAGEVQGDIAIRDDGRVTFFVGRCDNDPCTAFTEPIFNNTRFGPVSLGQTHTLSIAFDFAGKKFIFGFDDDTQEVSVAGVFSDTILPSQYTTRTGFKFKGIGTRVNFIDNPNEGVRIKATFDNVRVNGAPYDDFSANLIDRTKWDRSEFVRRVENGVFKSELTRFGSNGSNSLNFADPAAVNAYQADVTVTEVINVAASPKARLTGFFFNDGTPGVDQAGEVQGGIQIRHNGSQLRVQFFVGRCDDDPCTSFTEPIFDDTRFGPVSLGQPHTLSIAFDFAGKKFIFGFDGDTQEVSVAGVFSDTILPSQYTTRTGFKFKGIGTRVSGIGGPNEGAQIKATFDNVKLISLAKAPPLPGVMLLLLDD